MLGLDHRWHQIVLINDLGMQDCHVDLLLQAYVEKRFHKEFQVVNFIAFCVVNEEVVFLCFLFDANDFFADGAQFCGVVPDPAESVQHCFAVVAFPCNVVGYCLRCEVVKTLLIDLDALVEFLKVVVPFSPKFIQLFARLHVVLSLFGQVLLLNCWRRRLQPHCWNLRQ